MAPQPVVSTTFKRLKKEWDQEKARKALNELIAKTGGKNVSKKPIAGYYQIWVDSQRYAYHPSKPLSKPLMKAMFDQSYVSYNVEMTKAERKRHRVRQAKMNYTKDMAKQYEVFKSTKKALALFKEMKPSKVEEGESALSSKVGSIKLTDINGSGFKGLNQLLRQKVVDMVTNYKNTHGQLKLQADVKFRLKDIAGEEATSDVRSRQYEVLTDNDIKATLVRMISEMTMDVENREVKKSGLKLIKVDQITLHYAKYVPH
jgi:hypothetical protein